MAATPYVALGFICGVACTDPPVRWHGAPLSMQAAVPARLTVDTNGVVGWAIDSTETTIAADATACPQSFRAAVRGSRAYAAYWARRQGGRAFLMSVRSNDGGRSWQAPVAIDTVDRSVSACDRRAPAIAVDSRTGYVDVAYFMRAPEGAGVFFSHSMDDGATYHEPVAVVYGDREGAVAIAAHGDTVAIVYEDPNSRTGRIALALSSTAGHLFEQSVVASGAAPDAREPQIAIGGPFLAVAWREATASGATGTNPPARATVRVGRLR